MAKQKGNKTTVIFSRVSSEDQRDGFSLDAQLSLAIKYAQEHSLDIKNSWKVDESASKENDRKHFFAMVQYVKDNDIKHVIFDKVDRAVRGFKSATLIDELIQSHEVQFHFTRDHLILNQDSPPQELLRFYLSTVMGKYYIDNLKSEINKGLDQRWEQGYWNSKAPFGYKNFRDPKTNKATVIIDEKAAPIAQQIFELYATGNYPLEYFVTLIKKHYPDKITSKRIIEQMITNPFYYGYMRGTRGKWKDKMQKGIHEPLITKELFDQCQKIKGIRASNYHLMKKGPIPKPYIGIFKCGFCNHSITAESHKKASGKTYVYYKCANRKCDQHKVMTKQEELTEQIKMAFEPFRGFTPKATEAFITMLGERSMDLSYYIDKRTGEIAAKKMEINASIQKIDRLYQEEVISIHEHAEVMDIKRKTLGVLDDELRTYQTVENKILQNGLKIIELLPKVSDFMRLDGNELDKARLVKIVLSNPILKGRTIEFSYEKPFDVLLENVREKNWWARREPSRTSAGHPRTT